MKKGLLFLILISLSFSTMAQERFFEFVPGWRNLKILTIDENYTSIGYTSDGFSFHHYQFSNISMQGDLLDSSQFDIDTVQNLESKLTNDISLIENEIILTGSLKGDSSNRFYGTFLKFNEDLSDTIATKTYNFLPGKGTMLLTHLSVNDSTFILGGFLQNNSFTIYASLIETDKLGNVHWRQDYFCGNNCDLIPYHIQKASDNGYFFICKESHDLGSGNYSEKTAIIKTDSLGNEEYRLHPGNPDLFTVAGWVLPTDDGNYITAYSDIMIITETLPQANPDKTIWINKFDINGNNIFDISLWDYLPKVPDFGTGYRYIIRQMLITPDDNLLIVGATATIGFILKITQQGVPLWFRFISPPQAEGNDAGAEWTKILGITPTADGGYIMAGEYFSSPGNIYPQGIQTAFAAKVDEFGCLEPGCQIGDGVAELTKADLGLKVYPNPSNGFVNVSVSENVKVDKVRVYEVSGRVLLIQSPQPPSPRGSSISLDVSGLVPGMYLLEVETKDGYREVKRLVIE